MNLFLFILMFTWWIPFGFGLAWILIKLGERKSMLKDYEPNEGKIREFFGTIAFAWSEDPIETIFMVFLGIGSLVLIILGIGMIVLGTIQLFNLF